MGQLLGEWFRATRPAREGPWASPNDCVISVSSLLRVRVNQRPECPMVPGKEAVIPAAGFEPAAVRLEGGCSVP